MYYVRRNNKVLFLVFDILALFISYMMCFDSISGKYNLYFFFVLSLIALSISLFSEEYWTITDRGYLLELKSTFLYVLKLISLFLLYLVVFHNTMLLISIKDLSLPIFSVALFIIIYVFRTIAKIINVKYRDDSRKIIILSNFEDLNKFGAFPTNYQVVAYFNNSEKKIYNNIPIVHNMEEMREFLSHNRVDEIYANVSHESNVAEILEVFDILGIPLKINITPIFKGIKSNSTLTFQGDDVYLTSAIKISTLRQIILKRVIDITLGISGTILTALVAVIIYPKVRRQSPGPLIFKQVRIGQNGKRFEIYKFRSMYLDAEERKRELLVQNEHTTNLMFKMDNDPRVFPFGQKKRDWSLDELPQFINVLKGDMSVVGTRPPTVDEYEKYNLHHFKRMRVKPGITGMWQVNGRSDITDFEEVIKLDMKYIENWSLRLDIKIIVKTIMVVLKREGSK